MQETKEPRESGENKKSGRFRFRRREERWRNVRGSAIFALKPSYFVPEKNKGRHIVTDSGLA